jgi:hypothetical protein
VSCLEPSFVAGFKTWEALGRRVERVQCGYAIWPRFVGLPAPPSTATRTVGLRVDEQPGPAEGWSRGWCCWAGRWSTCGTRNSGPAPVECSMYSSTPLPHRRPRPPGSICGIRRAASNPAKSRRLRLSRPAVRRLQLPGHFLEGNRDTSRLELHTPLGPAPRGQRDPHCDVGDVQVRPRRPDSCRQRGGRDGDRANRLSAPSRCRPGSSQIHHARGAGSTSLSV